MRNSAAGIRAVAVLSVLLATGLALAGGARAQTYPPPVGSLSVEAASTTTGSTTSVTATVLDNSGLPIEGAEVIFRILSQPGNDAAWPNGTLETTATTDADGIATAILSAGSVSGTIIVETVSGELTSQVTVNVAAEAGGLPPTGGTPTESSGGMPAWQVALLAIGATMLAGGLVVIGRRRNRA